MANWQVVHYDHAGNALGETVPADLEFGYKHDDLAYINYDLNKGDPLATLGKTQSYVTDFILSRDNNTMLGGLHTQVEASDTPGSIKVSGKEWLHYFERRFYPFNPADVSPPGYTAIGVDLYQIFRDLVTTTLAEPNSLTGVTFSAAALGNSGVLGDYRIEPNDMENLYAKLTSISQVNPGFDFEMTPDRQINLYTPKRHDIPTSYTFELGVNVKSVAFTDRGPDGNHLFASATRGSSTVIIALDAPGPANLFRRLDYDQSFSTVQTIDQLNRQAQIDIGRASTPVFDLTIQIKSDYYNDVWVNLRPGFSVDILADLGYMVLDGTYQIVTMIGRLDKGGNESLELSFNA